MSILPPLTQVSAQVVSSRLAKRAFDLFVTTLAMIAWVPVLILSSLAVLVFDGGPIFYVSPRRVYRKQTIPVLKFRTMRRDADRIANRATVPIEGVRFLNIPRDSPLYSRVGRVLERCCFTELPQLLHVLSGKMSLVGNRPLPENVIDSLCDAYPGAEDRFGTPAGLTGPIQLAGRENLSDAQRLRIEIRYCDVARSSYSMSLDFMILLYTVLVVSGMHRSFTCEEIEELLSRHDRQRLPGG
jgi:lipopolysaccharide/colanic/teichoic acid biosynthesis glycosyltransferase